SGDALDLRSGPYRRRVQVQAGPWGRVAAMFVVCAALALGAGLADSRATQAQARALSDQARQSYQSVTGQPAPADLARAVRRAGPSDADPTAFLALSDVLFRSLSQHPDIRVERLSYDSTENALRLRLLYPGFDAPGALERTANQTGAVFVTGGVREQSGRYVGDASLRLEGTS
ncbi:MAG: type II secretion system protein GspL, partial [Litorimonas sp.]